MGATGDGAQAPAKTQYLQPVHHCRDKQLSPQKAQHCQSSLKAMLGRAAEMLPLSGRAKAAVGAGCTSQPPLHRLGWDPQATSRQSIAHAAEMPITEKLLSLKYHSSIHITKAVS